MRIGISGSINRYLLGCTFLNVNIGKTTWTILWVTNSLWELLEVHPLVRLWAEKLGKYDQTVTKYPATRSIQKHSLGYINLLKLMQLRSTECLKKNLQMQLSDLFNNHFLGCKASSKCSWFPHFPWIYFPISKCAEILNRPERRKLYLGYNELILQIFVWLPFDCP
jgi:hypothetical protein